jgi:hypothetical protein
MMHDKKPDNLTERDEDIGGYFAIAVERVKQYYKLFFALFAIYFVLVTVYAHFATPLYTAVAALSPRKDAMLDTGSLPGIGNMASVSRRLGLGSAGNSGSEDLFDHYSRILQSYRLAESLAKRPDFLALAFPREYDPDTKTLRPRGGFVAHSIDGVKQFLGLPLAQTNTKERVYALLARNLTVSTPQTITTDISEVSLRFNDPKSAGPILAMILEEADTLMRAEKKRDIAARIAYLKAQLADTTLEDQRSSIISNLIVQQNTMMVLSADRHYTNTTLEEPYTPSKATWPSGASLIGLMLFLTFLTWATAIFVLPPNNWLLSRFSREKTVFTWLRLSQFAARGGKNT